MCMGMGIKNLRRGRVKKIIAYCKIPHATVILCNHSFEFTFNF